MTSLLRVSEYLSTWAKTAQVSTWILARGQVGTQVVPGFWLPDAQHCLDFRLGEELLSPSSVSFILWRHVQNARVIRFVDCIIEDTKLRKEEEKQEERVGAIYIPN